MAIYKGEYTMKKEIDLRSLIIDQLDSDYMVVACSDFNNDVFGDRVEMRSFNNQITWSRSKQTGFIESIYMGCELPLIVVLQISSNPEKYLLIDGFNRFHTIKNFLSDKLKLSPTGLQKAAFLENKTYSELLSDEERKYFDNRGIQILKYKHKRELTQDELEAVAKQLYIRYNAGIQLKNEEIQKADYQNDWVTQQIEEKTRDVTFLNMLSELCLTPKKRTKTYVESTLMYCRQLLTSCYAPIEAYAKRRSILKRIDDFYYDYTAEINKEQIIKDFVDNISWLYELFQQGYWQSYPKLKNQYFIMITYWLLFHLKKYQLMNLKEFDWKEYCLICAKEEERSEFFSSYRVKLIDKYHFVIDYLKDCCNIDLTNYMVKEVSINSKNKVYDFSDLVKYNFQLSRDPITIKALLNQLEQNSFVLRPSYQRRELNDVRASSFLIESTLLNINIPDILVYRHETEEGKTIFEVVDGQQRCFSFLGYLNRKYKNHYQEEISSEKEGFALQGLTILSELNGKKTIHPKKEFKLDSSNVEKIRNGKIRIVYVPDKDNPYFFVSDYFTRVNKTISPLRKTSCRYWNAGCDAELMALSHLIARKFEGSILPVADVKYTSGQYVLNLAYLFYINRKEIKAFSVQQVFNWLNQFEVKKANLTRTNRDTEIEKERKKYKVALEQTELFLNKIEQFLKVVDKSFRELTAIKVNKRSFTSLLFLYYLLVDIQEIDLIGNAEKIYNIINSFFSEEVQKSMRKEILAKLENCCNKLSIFNEHLVNQNQFRQTMQEMMSC